MTVSTILTGCYRKTFFKRKHPNGAIGLWWVTGRTIGDATGGYILLDLRIDPPASLGECLSLEGGSLIYQGGGAINGYIAFFPALEYIGGVAFALRFPGSLIDTGVSGYGQILPFNPASFKGFIAFPTNPAVAMAVSGGVSTNVNGATMDLCAWGYLWSKTDILQGTPGAIPPAEVSIVK